MEKLSIAQVAVTLGMHSMTVQQLVLEGFIPSIKDGRRRWIMKEELDKIVQLREQHGRQWMKFVTPNPPDMSSRMGTPQNPVTR